MATTQGARVAASEHMVSGAHKLKTETDQLRARTEEAEAQAKRLQSAREEWQAALRSGDIDQIKIKSATFESLQRENAKVSKDVAQKTAILAEGFADIGVRLKSLEKLTPEGVELVTSAEATLEGAKGKLVQAQAGQWNIFGMRDKAIVRAKEDITTAEEALNLAKEQAELMRREALNSMDIRTSLQTNEAVTQELVEMAQGRIKHLEEQIANVQGSLKATQEDIRSDVDNMAAYKSELDEKRSALSGLRSELESLVEGTPEWRDYRDRVIAMEAEFETAETKHSATLISSKERERFLEMGINQERLLKTALSRQHEWIAILQIGSQNRSVYYESYLAGLQVVAEHDAMQHHDKVAVQIDEDIAMSTAQAEQAAQRAMLERVERMPEQLRRMRQINAASVANRVDWEQRMQVAFRDFITKSREDAGYDNRDTYREKSS